MGKGTILLLVGAVLAAAIAAPYSTGAASASPRTRTILAANVSATGTHQCRAPDGSTFSCPVTGSIYSNCVDATSSLRAQDCCAAPRACSRDSQGRESNCRPGGVSIGFSMLSCIPMGP